MIKKTLIVILACLISFIIVLTILFIRIDWTVKMAISLAGGKVDQVERVKIGHWKLLNFSYPIDDKNDLIIAETEIDILAIEKSASIFQRYAQALDSKINIKSKDIAVSGFNIRQFQCSIDKKFGKTLEINNINIADFGSKNRGKVIIDLASYEDIKIFYNNLNLDHLIKYFDATLGLSGLINLDAHLIGKDIDARIYGNNLNLRGFRVDDVISNFVDTRSIGFMDAAAFVALGPIGILYSSAASLGQTLGGFRGGITPFKQINIDVKLQEDTLILNDVAVATAENLVVVEGGADIKKQEFKDLIVSILDEDYCPQLQQAITGTFKNPEVSKTKAFLETASAPLESLMSSTFEVIGFDTCKRSYKGIVKHPKID